MFADIIKKQYNYLFSSSDKNTIAIGYGVDDNYMRCLAASIYSFWQHNNSSYNIIFHIMSVKLSDENKVRLQSLAQQLQIDIILYEIFAEQLKSLPTFAHLPIATYFRFLLPYILENTARVYYIDADILCLKPANVLFNISLDNNIAAAVPDVEWMNRKRNKALGLIGHTYFNAGLLIINIKAWNDFNTMDKVLQLLKSDPQKYRYLDQDALNIILHSKIKYLPSIFNSIDYNNINTDDIVLLHFAAHPKPWNIAWPISKICNSFNKTLYSYYENHTPWQNSPLQMPRNYKEMKIYAKALFHHKHILAGINWYFKYIATKFLNNKV